jgi:peptide-methionine (S)-S-oxide reductase
LKGVYRTRVGYAGGTLKDPTYQRLGDHTETFQVDYDPEQITYAELLEIFWESHSPTSRSWSRQYKPVIFYHSTDQEKLAEASKTVLEKELKGKIYTEIRPLEQFYAAEDYHQKYYLQMHAEFTRELRAYYPVFDDFVDSTAAARLNGYLAGYGDAESLYAELESFGLSEGALSRFKSKVE